MLQRLIVDILGHVTTYLSCRDALELRRVSKMTVQSVEKCIRYYLIIHEIRLSAENFRIILQIYLKSKINLPYRVTGTEKIGMVGICTFKNYQLYKGEKLCKQKELFHKIRTEISSLSIRRATKYLTDTELEKLMVGMYQVRITKEYLFR